MIWEVLVNMNIGMVDIVNEDVYDSDVSSDDITDIKEI
jgi:hypothetical protein